VREVRGRRQDRDYFRELDKRNEDVGLILKFLDVASSFANDDPQRPAANTVEKVLISGEHVSQSG